MNTRKLSIAELPLLTQLFDYNDINAMIAQNEREITIGNIDIFAMFDDTRLIGELHAAYTSDDERAIKGNRAYLYAFRIHEDYQGRGYGKQLFHNVIITLTKHDILSLLSVWRTIMQEQSISMTASDLHSFSPESMRNIKVMDMSTDCI